MNEINMVPFIDVMLVLLIIFMVSAPLVTTGVVDLPSVGTSNQRPATVIEVTVAKDGSLKVKNSSAKDAQSVTVAQLGAKVRELQQGDVKMPVVIAADRDVKYDSVVDAMSRLQEAGVQRVGLAVKQGSKPGQR